MRQNIATASPGDVPFSHGSVLAHIPLYALILTQGAVWTGFFAVTPAYRDALELSRFELGAISACFGLATVVTALPIGIVADRVGLRTLTVGSGVLLSLAALGHALAIDFWSLALARSAYAATVVLIWAASTTWLTQRVAAARRSAALAAMWPVLGVGTLVGPLFAASLVDRYGFRVPFVMIAVVAALIAAALARSANSPGPGRRRDPQLRGLLRAVRANAFLGGAVAIMLVGPIAETVLSILAPIQLDENGQPALLIGVAFSSASAAFVTVGILVTRTAEHTVRLSVAAASLALLAVPFLALLLTRASAVIVAALVLRMALLGVLYTISFALGVIGAEHAGIGSGVVAGLLMLASGVANVTGPFVGGALADAAGDRSAYALVAATCMGCAYWIATRSSRHRIREAFR